MEESEKKAKEIIEQAFKTVQDDAVLTPILATKRDAITIVEGLMKQSKTMNEVLFWNDVMYYINKYK